VQIDHYALPSSHRVSGRELAKSEAVDAFEVLNRLATQGERYSSYCEMMAARLADQSMGYGRSDLAQAGAVT
jgi:hypothetical protein